MEELKNWIKENPSVFGGVLSFLSFVFGVCLVLGSVKDWDWLYEPDEHYQNNWTMGQISHYMGRDVARFIGFLGGMFFMGIGLYFMYQIYSEWK